MKGFYAKRGEKITKLKEGKKELEVQIRREKKASQEYLDSILADASKLKSETAELKSEANNTKKRAEAAITKEQRVSTNAVRKERAAASSSSQRVRDRQAAASRLAAEQVKAGFKEEHKGWTGKIVAKNSVPLTPRCCPRGRCG